MKADVSKVESRRLPPEETEKEEQVGPRLEPWERGPTAPRLDPDQNRQVPLDPLEEESMESFPASDPPSHSRSTS